MKKLITITIIFAACLSVGLAKDKPVYFGVRAGMNNSTISSSVYLLQTSDNDMKVDYTFNFGFHVGAIADIKLPKNFRIETGVLFATRGYAFKPLGQMVGGIETKDKTTIHTFCLEIPVIAKYVGEVNKNLNIHFGIGGSIGVNLFDRFENKYDNSKKSEITKCKNLLYLGVRTELGFEIIKHLYLGLRYDFGTMSHSLDKWGNISNILEMKSHTIGITLGYNF